MYTKGTLQCVVMDSQTHPSGNDADTIHIALCAYLHEHLSNLTLAEPISPQSFIDTYDTLVELNSYHAVTWFMYDRTKVCLCTHYSHSGRYFQCMESVLLFIGKSEIFVKSYTHSKLYENCASKTLNLLEHILNENTQIIDN